MSAPKKNEAVVKFIAERIRGVNITRLQKLAYLADVEARKLLGEPVSTFCYEWYDYGPFDRTLYRAIDSLEADGLVEQEWVDMAPGYRERVVIDTGINVDNDLTDAEIEVLEFVIRTYGKLTLNDLKKRAYDTEPMKAVESQYKTLPMEIVDNVEKYRVGFDLNETIAREKSIRRGRYIHGERFFDGIRAKVRRTG